MPLPRRGMAAVVSAAVLATMLVTSNNVATAQPDDDATTECTPERAPLRYVVLFEPGTTRQAAEWTVAAACGALSGYYPEIAVAIATSTDADFGDRMGSHRAFSAQATMREDGRRPPRKADETRSTRARVTANPAGVSQVDRTGEQWNMTLIQADEARQVNGGDRDVVVGILDSGVDPSHPELRGSLDPALSAGCLTGTPDSSAPAWQPSSSPHGTHVAGTIAAADDGRGITGVAPGVRIASVKVVDDEGFIFPEYAVCGLMWASANKMTITNNSYFVDPWLMTCNRDGEHVVYESVRRAVDHATRRGVLTVAAASNESTDLSDPRGRTARSPAVDAQAPGQDRAVDSTCRVLPAGLRGVVAVSSVGPDKLKAGYSAYGLGVIDVTAPGGELAKASSDGADHCVLSTVPGGYERYCGTSMATPHVTGVAALLASEHPKTTPQKLTRMLAAQAESIPCPDDYDLSGTGAQDAYCSGYAPYNSFYGHGLVDALAAVTE